MLYDAYVVHRGNINTYNTYRYKTLATLMLCGWWVVLLMSIAALLVGLLWCRYDGDGDSCLVFRRVQKVNPRQQQLNTSLICRYTDMCICRNMYILCIYVTLYTINIWYPFPNVCCML